MTPDQKQAFANEAEKALEHPVVQDTIEELLFNLGHRGEGGLPRYGIHKVANAVATVARAHALGIDPDELRMSREESDEATLNLMRAFADAGKPVIVVEAPAGDSK